MKPSRPRRASFTGSISMSAPPGTWRTFQDTGSRCARRGFPGSPSGSLTSKWGGRRPVVLLGCNGRQVAYQYNGPETRVRANSAYRIEAFVRPDRLVSARACLSAHFLDKHGRILLDTMVRSQHVGGASGPSGWSRLELYLPAAPKEAARVGLVAWILQEPLWDTAALPKWHIPRVDVQAGPGSTTSRFTPCLKWNWAPVPRQCPYGRWSPRASDRPGRQ